MQTLLMVGDFVNAGGLLNVMEITDGFGESVGGIMMARGIAGVGIADGGSASVMMVVTSFNGLDSTVVGGGVIRGVRDITVTASMGGGVVAGGNINDVSGSLGLFTVVVVSGHWGSGVSGGGVVGRGDMG
jgi:hypothetical protein